MLVAYPTNDGKTVAEEFGRAEMFAVAGDGDVHLFENPGHGSSKGAGSKAAQFLSAIGVKKVVVKKPVGENAERALKALGIEVIVDSSAEIPRP